MPARNVPGGWLLRATLAKRPIPGAPVRGPTASLASTAIATAIAAAVIAATATATAAVVATATAAAAAATPLSVQEARGQRIFLEGGAPGAAGIALIGSQSLKVPASRMPCASCHGPDGTGRPEGGVVPPDVTWPHLAKSYGHVHANGRAHGAFDAAALARAIAEGIDPAGNRLDAAMPRYRLPRSDMADLLAFLQRLGTVDLAPGLDDTTVRIATVLPVDGPMADAGRAIRAVLAACFDEVNAQGGIFGRRIELVMLDRPPDGHDAGQALRRSLADAFAVVGALLAGAEARLLPLIEGERVPLVGPVTLFPKSDAGPPGRTFYLLPGVRQQAVALIERAARESSPKRLHVAVVHPDDGPFGDVVQAVGARAQRHGWSPVGAIGYRRLEPARLVAALAGRGVDTVLFLGSGAQFDALRAAAAEAGWAPRFLVSGSLTGAGALAGSDEASAASAGPRTLVAYPMLPSDQSERGRAELQALRARHGLSSRHLPMQIAAYGAAKVLVEGLKAAGRDLTRERLVGALERLDRFDTGLTPAISYGPNRRVGALGAHVLAAPLAARRDTPPPDAWLAIEPP